MSKLKVEVNKEAKELIMIREFNAPKQQVWNAYTQKELLEQWWGPKDWKTTVKSIDFRVGGEWFYCMKAPQEVNNGMESCGKAYYQEIDEPNKLVYKDTFVNADGSPIEEFKFAEMIITIYFEENNGVTTLRTVTVFETEDALMKVVEMGVEQGSGEQFDRLEEFLK